MRFERVAMRKFPPFTDGMMSFPETEEKGLAEVQLITGENGTGKTRLLCALAAACGNSNELDSRHERSDAEYQLAVGMIKGGQSAIYFRTTQQILTLKDKSDASKLFDNFDALAPQSPRFIVGRMDSPRKSVAQRQYLRLHNGNRQRTSRLRLTEVLVESLIIRS